MSSEQLYSSIERLRLARPAPGVLLITIDRPEARNALDVRAHRELGEIWRLVDADPLTSVTVIAGEGGAFSAGGDKALLAEMITSHEAVLGQLRDAGALVRAMIECEKPIVSSIEGVAVGAGLAAALLADISVIGRSARLSDGHLRIGVAAGDHAVLIWPLLCGMARAKYHLLTAGFVDGVEAERIGLVSRCVPDDEVRSTALEIASQLAASSQPALRFTKRALNHWLRAALPAFEHSLALEMLTFLGPDAAEGVAALSENRPPVFPSGTH